MRSNHHNLPAHCRPPAKEGAAFDRFANYFASYLTTSFDLVADPGVQRRSTCGCRCWCCAYLAAAPHLKARRVSSIDKKRASKLKLDYLQQLALDRDRSVPETRLLAIATDAGTASQVALLAYTAELIGRCSGRRSTPATLALWRQFAWLPTGSPKPGFELRVQTILEAEAQITHALEKASRSRCGSG